MTKANLNPLNQPPVNPGTPPTPPSINPVQIGINKVDNGYVVNVAYENQLRPPQNYIAKDLNEAIKKVKEVFK